MLYPGLCWASVPASDHTQPCPDAWLHTEDYSIQLGYAADMLVSVQPQTAGFRWFPSRLDAWFCPFQFDDLFCQQLDDPLEYVYIMYIHYKLMMQLRDSRDDPHTHTISLSLRDDERVTNLAGRMSALYSMTALLSIALHKDCILHDSHPRHGVPWHCDSCFTSIALCFKNLNMQKTSRFRGWQTFDEGQNKIQSFLTGVNLQSQVGC